MYYLAACNDDGVCVGFLRNDKTISTNPDAEVDSLMAFKRKTDANETILQTNLAKLLMPNQSYRLAVVRG